MGNVYMIAIILFVVLWIIIAYAVCMSGYTTKCKNPDDYMGINKRQRDKDIAKIKAQDEYDNKWGML